MSENIDYNTDYVKLGKYITRKSTRQIYKCSHHNSAYIDGNVGDLFEKY